MKELTRKLEECQSIDSQADATKAKLNKLKTKLANVIKSRKAAEADAASKRDRVNDLRKQLADAEKDLADAEIKLSDIKEEEDRLPRTISQVERELKLFLEKSKRCKSAAQALKDEIRTLRTEEAADLAGQIE